MEYNHQLALQIQKQFSVSDTTLRVWKSRGAIPKRYFEKEERVTLLQVAKDSEISNPTFVVNIQTVLQKFEGLQELLENRKFKANQSNGYYSTCLISLCKECKQKDK